jgi:hypothetical protein
MEGLPGSLHGNRKRRHWVGEICQQFLVVSFHPIINDGPLSGFIVKILQNVVLRRAVTQAADPLPAQALNSLDLRRRFTGPPDD